LTNYRGGRSSGRSRRSGGSGGSGPSARTGGSRASGSSIDSAATVNSVNSAHSLQSLARKISADLYPQETLVAALRTWLATVDPAAYRRELPWRPEVQAAYDEYKRRAHEHGTAHTAFRNCLNDTRRNTTPEQHIQRAQLAVEWGEAAVKYVILMLSAGTVICLAPCPAPYRTWLTGLFLSRAAEGRLSFIDTYRNAYSSANSIRTHIDTGETAIVSGRNAVAEARRNYDCMNIPVSKLNDYG
jgi:hypothetical protein